MTSRQYRPQWQNKLAGNIYGFADTLPSKILIKNIR
jgi:hypothetical protein